MTSPISKSGWNCIRVDSVASCNEKVSQINSQLLNNNGNHMLCILIESTVPNILELIFKLRQISYLMHIIIVISTPVPTDQKSLEAFETLLNKCLLVGGTFSVEAKNLDECLDLYKPTLFHCSEKSTKIRELAWNRANNVKGVQPSDEYEIDFPNYKLEDLPLSVSNAVNPEYLDVKDKIEKYFSIVQNQDQFKQKCQVQKIEKYSNPLWEKRFWRRYAQLSFPTDPDTKGIMKYFHGTTQEAFVSILKGGFKLPPVKGQWFGPGIYAANDTNYSIKFMNNFNKIFLCDVAIGDAQTFMNLNQNNLPKHIRPWNFLPTKDSTYNATKRGTTDNIAYTKGELYQDERIVYHPSQIIIRYVVTFNLIPI